jgi:hypothetical protein
MRCTHSALGYFGRELMLHVSGVEVPKPPAEKPAPKLVMEGITLYGGVKGPPVVMTHEEALEMFPEIKL